MANPNGNPNWKPGQSGNPAGRPIDPERRAAQEMLKAASPELMETAIRLAVGHKPEEGKAIPPDTFVLVNLIKKILPDSLNLDVTLPVALVMNLKGRDEEDEESGG